MKRESKILIGSILVNIFLIIIKTITGLTFSSKSLIAHAISSLSDLITDIIAILGNLLSKKDPNKKHPYGYGKVEYLTCFIMGIFIICIAISLIIKSFCYSNNILSNSVMIISILSLIIKFSYAKFMLKSGIEYQSNILIVSSKEAMVDALTSIIVIISALLSRLSSYSDNICTLLISIYIAYMGIKIIKDNAINIIGTIETNEEYLIKIKEIILNNKEILSIRSINIIKYGSYNIMNLDIIFKNNLKLTQIKFITDKIKEKLKYENIKYINIDVSI